MTIRAAIIRCGKHGMKFTEACKATGGGQPVGFADPFRGPVGFNRPWRTGRRMGWEHCDRHRPDHGDRPPTLAYSTGTPPEHMTESTPWNH